MLSGIKELRLERAYTQSALAKKLNVSQGTVALWESGKWMPTADKLPQIAKALECSIDDLFKTNT